MISMLDEHLLPDLRYRVSEMGRERDGCNDPAICERYAVSSEAD